MAESRIGEEADSRDAQEKKSMSSVEKHTKACPGCKVPTQNISGCENMTCKSIIDDLCRQCLISVFAGRRCKHEYCWICLADYRAIHRNGNGSDGKECRYHTRNMNSRATTPEDDSDDEHGLRMNLLEETALGIDFPIDVIAPGDRRAASSWATPRLLQQRRPRPRPRAMFE